MKEQFLEFTILRQEHSNDILIAALDVLPVQSFWEDECLKFYISRSSFDRQVESELNDLADKWGFIYSFEIMPNINWNARWEAGFEPVEVGSFCRIRASFHEPQDDFEHEVIVDPKMAFGTGHHATTYMMIEQMRDLGLEEKSILDYGTGTGILAILARKLGARIVFGNDIEEPAIENARANAVINETPDIDFELGDINVIPSMKFDVILANINRNVLIDSLDQLKGHLADPGFLVMSGILLQDEEILKRHIAHCGLSTVRIIKREDWLSFKCSW